jgi:hypothetical protein
MLSFLGQAQPFDYMGSQRYSTLVAGLQECRVFTKRIETTGKYDPEMKFGDEGSCLGAIGYFTILDQIGSCFKPMGEPEPAANINTIKFAIEKFAYDLIGNNDHKLNALIALRNAFTHDFNLLNIPKNGNPLQVHKFTVTAKPNENWIVELPSIPWDQNIEEKNFTDNSDTTFVNLFAFGELTETVYSRIYDLLQNNNLEIRVPTLRLINKYTFVTSNHPIK